MWTQASLSKVVIVNNSGSAFKLTAGRVTVHRWWIPRLHLDLCDKGILTLICLLDLACLDGRLFWQGGRSLSPHPPFQQPSSTAHHLDSTLWNSTKKRRKETMTGHVSQLCLRERKGGRPSVYSFQLHPKVLSLCYTHFTRIADSFVVYLPTNFLETGSLYVVLAGLELVT